MGVTFPNSSVVKTCVQTPAKLLTSRIKLLLCASTFVVISGCDDFENEPKDPFVEGDPFVLAGNQVASEISLANGEARHILSLVTDAARSTVSDGLTYDDENERYLSIDNYDYRFEEDGGWLKHRARKTIFGGLNQEGSVFFMLDTSAITLSLYTRSSVIADDSADDTEPEPEPIDLTAGAYSCVEQSINPQPKVQIYTVNINTDGTVDFGGNADKTLIFTDQDKIELVDSNLDIRQCTVDNFATEDEDHCDIKNDLGDFPDAQEGYAPFYSHIRNTFMCPDTYFCGWESKYHGGATIDGSVFHLARLAAPTATARELVDVSPKDDLDDATGIPMSTSRRLPPEFDRYINPRRVTEPPNQGYDQAGDFMVCVRQSSGKNDASLVGDFWMGKMFVDNGDPAVVLSSIAFDGQGGGVDTQLKASSGLNLRESNVEYSVTSNNGNLTVNGRPGILSENADVLVFDASSPDRGVYGLSIALKKYVAPPAE